jgi:transposase
VEGATTKAAVFEAYVEQVLAPSLRAGEVAILDTLGAHRGEGVREMVEARGCSLLFLPPYSPDFSPIEEAFSKIKASLLRKAAARTREALVEAMGRGRSTPSRRRTPGAGSPTAGTRSGINVHEHRCEMLIGLMGGADEDLVTAHALDDALGDTGWLKALALTGTRPGRGAS